MASLYTKTKLYIEANSKTWDDTKVSLRNNSDGNGDFISFWTYDGLEKPTDEQIASYETGLTFPLLCMNLREESLECR